MILLLNIVYLIAGLGLILWGANALTDGSSAVAKRFGVSELMIGLTVIAFGTSMPEMTISVLSAIQGSPGLAIGNVVGSNIFNILAIIGIVALVAPIKVEKGIIVNEMPLTILSSVVILTMGNSLILDGNPNRVLSRIDGIILLLFFIIFMRYVFSQARKSPEVNEPANAQPTKKFPMWKAILFIVLGLAALIFGGNRFVTGASYIAAAMGVSETVIGLTIVAVGTSLPELATGIVSAVKKRPGLVVGNVVGSCIFNIFLILGVTATIRPIPFGDIGNFDLLTLTLASILFWVFGVYIRQRTITRLEGALLTIIYIAWLIFGII